MVPAEYYLLLGDEAGAGLKPRILDVAGETKTGDAFARVRCGHRLDRGHGGRTDEARQLAQPLAHYVAAIAVVIRKHLVAAIARERHLDVLTRQLRQVPGAQRRGVRELVLRVATNAIPHIPT